MVASLLKIVSTGIQDERLQPPKDQPTLDSFVTVIVKTGRYATQWARIDFDTAPNFGQSAVARLPTQGEMIGRVLLVTRMPDIQTAQLAAQATPIPIKITGTEYICPIPVYYSVLYINKYLQPIIVRYQGARDTETVSFTNYQNQIDIMNITNLLVLINSLKAVLNAIITEYSQTRTVLQRIQTIYTNMVSFNAIPSYVDSSGYSLAYYKDVLLPTLSSDVASLITLLVNPQGPIASAISDLSYAINTINNYINTLYNNADSIAPFTLLNDPSQNISDITTTMFLSSQNISILNNYISILNGYLLQLNANIPINIDNSNPHSIHSIYTDVVAMFGNVTQYSNNTIYQNIITNIVTPYAAITVSSIYNQQDPLDNLIIATLSNMQFYQLVSMYGNYINQYHNATPTIWTQYSDIINRVYSELNDIIAYISTHPPNDNTTTNTDMLTLQTRFNSLRNNNPIMTPYSDFGGPNGGGLYEAWQTVIVDITNLNNNPNNISQDPYATIRNYSNLIIADMNTLINSYSSTGSYNTSNPGQVDYTYDPTVNIQIINHTISDYTVLHDYVLPRITLLISKIQILITGLSHYTGLNAQTDLNAEIQAITAAAGAVSSSFSAQTYYNIIYDPTLNLNYTFDALNQTVTQIQNDTPPFTNTINSLNSAITTLNNEYQIINTGLTSVNLTNLTSILARYSTINSLVTDIYTNVNNIHSDQNYQNVHDNFKFTIDNRIQTNIFQYNNMLGYYFNISPNTNATILTGYKATLAQNIIDYVSPTVPEYNTTTINSKWYAINNDLTTIFDIHTSSPPFSLNINTIMYLSNFYNYLNSISSTLASIPFTFTGDYSINQSIPDLYTTDLTTYNNPVPTTGVTSTLALYTADHIITLALYQILYNIESFYIINSPTSSLPPPPFRQLFLNDLIPGNQHSIHFTIPYNPNLHVLLSTDPTFNTTPPPVFTQCVFSIFITDTQLPASDTANLPNSYTWPLDPSLINGTYGTQTTLPPISGFPTGTVAQWSNSPVYGSGINYNIQLYNNPTVVNLPTFTYTAITSKAYITYGIYTYTNSPVTVTLTPLKTMPYYPFFDGDPNGAYRVSFAGPRFGWTNSLGHALLNQASVSIGGVQMDTIPGSLMEILDEFQTPLEKVSETNRQLCRNSSNFTSSSFGMDNTSQEVITHLPFWFSRGDPGCLLPIDALNIDEVRITVQFNPVTSLYYTDSRLVDASGVTIQTATPGGSLWPMANSEFYYCYPSGTSIPAIEPPLYKGVRKFSKYPGVSMTNILKMVESYLLVEYIYLDKPEANRFRVADIQVPIVQHYTFDPHDNQTNTYARMRLVIPNPTRDLFFYCQRYTAPGYNATLLGTRDLSNTLVPYAPWWPDATGLDDHYYGNIRSGFSTRNSEPIRWLSLDYSETLNRYSTENVALFRSLLPSMEQRKAPFTNRYYYNIPLGSQNGFTPFSTPMGEANLDKILRLNLSLGFHGKTGIVSADFVDRYNVHVFAETYNIFRVYGGRGTLMFAY